MNEREIGNQLQAFRSEIQSHIERLRGKDATIVLITDVNELDEEDMEKWDVHKTILRGIKDLDIEADPTYVQEYVERLFILSKSLSKKVSQDQKKLTADSSKSWFLNWLNNQICFTHLESVHKKRSTVVKLKELLKNKIDDYLV